MPQLTIIRGLPGAGKSTFAKGLIETFNNAAHFEADMFFMNGEKYNFNNNMLSVAHAWCLLNTYTSLNSDICSDVIVSNTFTTKREIQNYLNFDIDYAINIITIKSDFESIHNVPENVIQKMKDRWEDIEGETIIDLRNEKS